MAKYLKREDYDLLLASTLIKLGVDERLAPMIIQSRWPMGSHEVLCECFGRGLHLSEADLEEWIWEVKGAKLPDGSHVDVHRITFDPVPVETFLEWAVSKGRGKPVFDTPVDELLSQRLKEGHDVL